MINLDNLDKLLEFIGSQEVNPNWKEAVDAKIPDNKIKVKDTGKGFKPKYVEGSTVIDILNKAFKGKWSFIPLEERIEPAIKKDDKTNSYVQIGSYAVVKGMLIVPGLGMKIQYGTQVILGGADVQQSAFKGAGTDCLKKCATLFGVGAELYDNDDTNNGANNYANPSSYAKSKTWDNKKNTPQNQFNKFNQNQTPQPTKEEPKAPMWNKADTDKLVSLKQQLEIIDNSQLDPFTKEYLNNNDATWEHITPQNISDFNKFLEIKIITS